MICDCRKEKRNYYFSDVFRMIEENPGKSAYFLQNFQCVLSGEADIRRLNFSRDMLAAISKNIIFCVTQDTDDMLNRKAYDFYSFIKLSLSFTDESGEIPSFSRFSSAPADRSLDNLDEEPLDLQKSEAELSNRAITLGQRARELTAAYRFRDALRLLEQVRRIREDKLGSRHPDLATTYIDIGMVYFNKGEYEEALRWFQKAIVIQEQTLGTQNLGTADTYLKIGRTYENLG